MANNIKVAVKTSCGIVAHRFRSPLWVARELARGHTLFRVLFHAEAKGHAAHGRTLDIGSKSLDASYYRYLVLAEDVDVVFTDLNARPGVVQLNVEDRFPFDDQVFDTVLAFNLFEHVFTYANAPHEVMRVIRPGGKVLLCVPFLHEYHPDPDDYFRFTSSALRRIWEEAGFRCVSISALGEGLLTFALTKVAALVLPRPLYKLAAPLLYLVSHPVDRLIALRRPIAGMRAPQRFPLGYFCVFEK